MLLPLRRQEPFDPTGTTAPTSGSGNSIPTWKKALITGSFLFAPFLLPAQEQAFLRPVEPEETPVAAAMAEQTAPEKVSPTYALPVSRFIIGTDNLEVPTSSVVEISGTDADRPGLEGFRAWISKFVKKRSAGLDWNTLQELHALYAEALVGNATHLSLMQEASQAIMGEQDGKFHKIKFLNTQDQNIAELVYTQDGYLSLRPVQGKHFYSIEESPLTLSQELAKGIAGVKISKDGRLLLKKSVSNQAVQQVVDNIVASLQEKHPQATAHVRMGNHEFGIQSSGITRRFQTGNLHLHIEFTLPDEQKIISYTVAVDANSLTENKTLSNDDLSQKYQTVFQGISSNVNWPTHHVMRALSGDVSATENMPGTYDFAMPLFDDEGDQAFIAEQLQSSVSRRISEQDKSALKTALRKLKVGTEDLTVALKNIIGRTSPAILLLGVDVPSEAPLLGSLENSFPMIGYKGATLDENLSLLRPNQENMIFLYAHGRSVNGFNNFRREWSANLFSPYLDAISITTLADILDAIRKYNSGFTHLLVWTCYAGQTLEDYMKLIRKKPQTASKINLYIPSGVYELRTDEVAFHNRQSAPNYFSSILDHMSYYIHHGETSTLAQKVVIEGKVIEPLAISIKQVKEILQPSASTSYSPEMIQDYQNLLTDMQALRDISLARTPQSFKKALLAYAKLHPGYVKVDNIAYEMVANKMKVPTSYQWSNREEILAELPKSKSTATILLPVSVTNYVSATAQTEYTKLKIATPAFTQSPQPSR
ncbi:MAG: hypothetical protein IKN49_01035 [Elusimicrobiaceae bacterium]|nr:hypothetical protein [Elusimicrobiaceae bacterium]